MTMSSSGTSPSCSNYTNSKLKKQFSLERRPQMLKDFLIDDSHSCSSSGFKSFPRRLKDRSMRNLIQVDLKAAGSHSYSRNAKTLLRSRSKAAASTTISAFQAIINSVKSIQFNAVKSPSILPRSLSRRLSKKHNTQNKRSENNESEIKMTVRIKDIIRWKSFRDLVEENPQPSDLAYSLDHHNCATTTTGSTYSSCSNSNGSSWCDSDFTAEDLPLEDYLPGVGSDCIKAPKETTANIAVGPKEFSCEEKEQRSPVSVIDFQFEEDESLLSFNRTLDRMEKTKQELLQRIQHFEGLAKVDPLNLEEWISMDENYDGSDEEKQEEDEKVNDIEDTAMLLLSHVKATTPVGYCEDNDVEQLLFDFFIDELSTKRNEEIDDEMIGQAKKWINGEHGATIDWEEYVRGIDKKFGKWNKFEEEQEEMGLQIEIGMLNLLVDEALADLLVC